MGVTDGLLLSGALRENTVERSGFTDDELDLIRQYEVRFLRGRTIAEKLYCDICFRENRQDGCRASVSMNGFVAIARIECRCRIKERKGITH